MISRIDTLNSNYNWLRLYNELPVDIRSVFFSPSYYQSYAEVDISEAECFWIYQDEQNFLFYPYIIKSINDLGYNLYDDYYDVSGAYGYNGPIGVVNDELFLKKYNSELKAHLLRKNVVTEFVRYCPIVGNQYFHTYPTQINALDNVYIDLSRGMDWVWNESLEYGVRKAIKKGNSYGLRTRLYVGDEINENYLKQFYDIYTETMNRNDAESFYFFGIKFFHSITINLKGRVILAITYLEDTPISAELLLVDGELVYGFLGGTLGDYYKYKANTFQRFEIIKRLIDIGVKKYSIGGGASRGDSIYAFKMTFAQQCKSRFYIGTQVHNEKIYKEIINQWEHQNLTDEIKNNFKLQRYRNNLSGSHNQK